MDDTKLKIIYPYILQWNCRSLKTKRIWLDQSLFNEATIIMLQETFLDEHHNFNFKNKINYREDRNSHGGGLLIAVSKEIPSIKIDINPPDSENEILCVKVKFEGKWIQLMNIYSPKGIFNSNWLNFVTSNIQDTCIIAGDFNIHHPYLGSSKKSKDGDKVMNWVDDNNLVLLNSSTPTHITFGKASSLIDLTLSTTELAIALETYVSEENYDSDHHVIITKLPHSPKNETVRKRINWINFRPQINKKLENNKNITLNGIIDDFKSTIETNTVAAKQTKVDTPPFWTMKCTALLKKKRYLLKRAKRNINGSEWMEYKKTAAQLRFLIKSLSKNYWDKVCKEAGDNKSIYKILKSLKSKKEISQESTSSNGIIKIDNTTLTSKQSQANEFILKYAKNDNQHQLPLDFNNGDDKLKGSFRKEEFYQVIKNMKNRSPGPDGITTKMIKELSQENMDKILDVLNVLWDKGEVPEGFKSSIIVPIKKLNKNPEDINSYRPISLTSVLSKIFEKLVTKRLTDFIIENKVLNPFHFGFIQGRGCEEAQTAIYTSILKARVEKKFVMLIAIDLREAYDSVWLAGLVLKCLMMGLSGFTVKWIEEFLQGRKAKVRWKNIFSVEKTINKGVPQGSVISPVLFTIYLRDIFTKIPNHTQAVVFADDVSLIVTAESLEALKLNCNETLTSVESWCDEWKMKIQTSKSILMDLSNKREKLNFEVTVRGEKIPWVNNAKILGIWFSPNLNFRTHVEKTREKAIKQLNILRAIGGTGWGVRSYHLLEIANACIRSILDYAPLILMSTSEVNKKKLETTYNSMLRFALGLPKWTPLPVLFRESRQLNLTKRLELRNFISHVKQIKHQSPNLQKINIINGKSTENVYQRSPFGLMIETKYKEIGVDKNNILQACRPVNMENLRNIRIYTEELPFQIEKKNPHDGMKYLLEDYLNTEAKNGIIISTDASKTETNCAVAIINFKKLTKLSGTLPEINSVFTGEAIAITIAINKYVTTNEDYFIFTDSLSVLRALKKKLTIKSPAIILKLAKIIEQASEICSHLNIIWIPSHSGLEINEQADKAAKEALSKGEIIKWVSPEDIIYQTKKKIEKDSEEEWGKNKYSTTLPNLYALDKKTKIKLANSRKNDVLLTRIRTNTLPTKEILHKCRLEENPKCTCNNQDTENIEHILLKCRLYDQQREKMKKKLGMTPPSVKWLTSFEEQGKRKAKALIEFFRDINRF